MKVKLRVGAKTYGLDSEAGGPLVVITANASNTVSAEIEVEARNATGSYVLQLGNQPDIRASVDLNEHSTGVFEWRNPDGIYVRSFQLFRGTMGTSVLYAVADGNGERTFIPLAEVVVLLADDDVRGDYYDSMVQQLLDQRLPHFVLDDFKWQMARNQFSLGWDDGYTSVENPDVMFRALLRVVQSLKPLLAEIESFAQVEFSKCLRCRSVSQVSCYNARVERALDAMFRRLSTTDVCDASEAVMLYECRVATYNTPAHNVISTFLQDFVLRRLGVIKDNLLSRMSAQKTKMSQLNQTGLTSPSKRNIYTEELSVLQSLIRKWNALIRLREIVIGMLSYKIFSFECKPLSIFDVAAGEFSASTAYWKVYSLIYEFSRARFWWIGDTTDGIWRIPKVEMRASGMSRLQLKYSIVYENWCYAQLVVALLALGYECCEGRSFQERDGGSALFRRGEIKVRLIHGITAHARRKNLRSEFVYEGANADKKTPDFAMLVSDGRSGSSAWIVLDAKSDDRLRKHMVVKRNDYAAIKWQDKIPLASVLIRSGEADGIGSGIEFPPPRLPDARKKYHDFGGDEVFDDHSGDDYLWKNGYGIQEGVECTYPYHGHVRVNVDSLAKGGSVFREFVGGIIMTAMRIIRA